MRRFETDEKQDECDIDQEKCRKKRQSDQCYEAESEERGQDGGLNPEDSCQSISATTAPAVVGQWRYCGWSLRKPENKKEEEEINKSAQLRAVIPASRLVGNPSQSPHPIVQMLRSCLHMSRLELMWGWLLVAGHWSLGIDEHAIDLLASCKKPLNGANQTRSDRDEQRGAKEGRGMG